MWQALKYACYCANLKKQQVVEIFQRYLNQKAPTGAEPADAGALIAEFLEPDDLERRSSTPLQVSTYPARRCALIRRQPRCNQHILIDIDSLVMSESRLDLM